MGAFEGPASNRTSLGSPLSRLVGWRMLVTLKRPAHLGAAQCKALPQGAASSSFIRKEGGMHMPLLDYVGTLLVDPSGATLATAMAAEALAKDGKDRSDTTKPSTPTAAGAAPTGSGGVGATPCCNEYQLQGNFLLNARTGAVWLYDTSNNQFKYVERVEPEITKSAWAIIIADLIDRLQTEKSKAASTVHYSVAAAYEKNIETMVKILQAKAGGRVPPTS